MKVIISEFIQHAKRKVRIENITDVQHGQKSLPYVETQLHKIDFLGIAQYFGLFILYLQGQNPLRPLYRHYLVTINMSASAKLSRSSRVQTQSQVRFTRVNFMDFAEMEPGRPAQGTS